MTANYVKFKHFPQTYGVRHRWTLLFVNIVYYIVRCILCCWTVCLVTRRRSCCLKKTFFSWRLPSVVRFFRAKTLPVYKAT